MRGVAGDHGQLATRSPATRAWSPTSAPLAFGTRAVGRARDPHRRPARGRRSRSSSATIAPRAARAAARLHHRPARGDSQRRLRPLGHRRPRAGRRRRCRSGWPTTRLHPALRRARLGDRPDDVRRRARPGGDDPADHQRRRPRGVLADAARAPGGRARARRHALGDDPHGVLPFGRSARRRRARCSASAARSARRWRSRSSSRSPAAITFNLISSANPSTIAANIALQFPESSGLDVNMLIAPGLVLFAITLVVNMAGRPSSPVRRGTADEHDSRAAAESGRADRAAAARPAAAGPRPRGAARMGAWSAYGVTAALVAAIRMLTGLNLGLRRGVRRDRGRPRRARASRVVEGRRRANDRDGDVVVTSAFAARDRPARLAALDGGVQGGRALRRRLLHRVDAQRDRRRRRRLHAIVGTIVITAATTLLSVPIGDHGGDLPAGVRRRPTRGGADVLRGRHDRHSVDRRGAVRLRAVRDVLRPRHPPGRDGRGRAERADDPDRRPVDRGDAEDRPGLAARGLLRARRAQVADDRPDRAADRAGRDRHG